MKKRLSVEASKTDYWHKYVGLEGDFIGVDKFGVSGHYSDMHELYGFTVENIKEKMSNLLDNT